MKRNWSGGLRLSRRVALLLVMAAVALGGGGCSYLQRGGATTAADSNAALPVGGAPVKNADRYKVVAETTPFYRYGPQQLNGSDQDLKKETRITMVQRGRGFSQVRLADGQAGYVGTEDISALDANEIATEDAAKLAAAAALAPPGALTGPQNGGPAYSNGPRVSIPTEAGRSESLPTQDPLPAATPPPPGIFRY